MIRNLTISALAWLHLEYRCRKCRVLYRLRQLGLYKGTIDFVVKAKPIRINLKGSPNGGV